MGSAEACWPQSHAVSCHIPDESWCEAPGFSRGELLLLHALEMEGRERGGSGLYTLLSYKPCAVMEKTSLRTLTSTWEMPPPMQPPLHSSESRNDPFSFCSLFE